MEEKEQKDFAGVDLGSMVMDEQNSEESSITPTETVKESENGEEGKPETSEEENKVSYSRFKNVHTRYREAEKRASELEARLQELEEERTERFERETPSFESSKYNTWKKLFVGENAQDTEQLREAYRIYMSEFAPLDESSIQKIAAQAYQQEARNEERRVESNERTLDDQLEDVSISVGRDLTEDEQVAVLDIMDEFSVKDENGMILSLYPADKAWDMYEIQSQGTKSQRTQTRDKLAGITGSGTRGDITARSAKKDEKDFDPRWQAFEASMSRRMRS